jgi:hypothetical protein
MWIFSEPVTTNVNNDEMCESEFQCRVQCRVKEEEVNNAGLHTTVWFYYSNLYLCVCVCVWLYE